MRSINGFLVCVIMLLCAHFAACPLYGQDAQKEKSRAYTFSTGTKFGILAGHAEEIVYPEPDLKAELESQLLWNMKPVVYYGLSLDFSQTQPMTQWGFFSTLSLKNAIPGKSGKMEDRDWMSRENTALTHYSIHDNYTNGLFLLDFSAGLSFPIKHILLLRPYINLSYMHFDFSGRYGHGTYARQTPPESGIYAPINDSPVRRSYSNWEKVINYTQDWLTVSPGISIGYYFLDHFLAELFFQISPWITCNDLDEHLTTNTQYRDYLRGGLLLEPGFHFSFIPGKRLELSLDFSWRYIAGTRGETYRTGLFGSNYSQFGEAGAGLSLFDTGICLKIRL